MTLVKVLESASLPSFLMETNFLRVPVEGFNGTVIHLSLNPCNSAPFYSDAKSVAINDFYGNLKDNFVSSQTLFKNISFNEFLETKDLFCPDCSLDALVNSNGFVLTGTGFLTARELIKSLLHWVNRMSLDVSSADSVRSFKNDWLWFHGFNMHLLLSSFPETVSFVEEFKNVLFKTQVGSVEQLRVDCVNFILDETFGKVSTTETSTVTTPDVINDYVNSFRGGLQDKLLSNDSFVIVDSFPVQRAWVSLSYGPSVFRKIAFSPDFNVSKFSVISYVEFKALELMLVSSKSGASLLSNHVVCETKPSPAVIKLMEELFDENNVTLKKYENLFNVAVNI